jgi:hypothetical protein
MRVQILEWFEARTVPNLNFLRLWESKVTQYPSFVERQNLTMRMSMRRFTRLTNAFSKKLENHEAAIALHYMHYNYCRVHQTLRVTPAMEAGIAKHVWSIEELVELLDRKSILDGLHHVA